MTRGRFVFKLKNGVWNLNCRKLKREKWSQENTWSMRSEIKMPDSVSNLLSNLVTCFVRILWWKTVLVPSIVHLSVLCCNLFFSSWRVSWWSHASRLRIYSISVYSYETNKFSSLVKVSVSQDMQVGK